MVAVGQAFIRDFDAQLAWHAAQYQAPAPHPAPIVGARPAAAHEIAQAPRTVAAMRSLAWKCGWRANVTYAHGTTMMANGKPGRLVESLALRLRYDDTIGAVAVWETNTKGGWTLDCAWFWPCTGEAFAQHLRADELKHVITEASVICAKPAPWRWMAAIDVVARFRDIREGATAARKGASAQITIIDEMAGQAALPLAA